MSTPHSLLVGHPDCGPSAKKNMDAHLRGHTKRGMRTLFAKEANFFSLHFDESLEWYAGYFADASGQTAIAEASPNYMWRPDVARLIHELIPDAKLIFVLRDPVDRAYSNFWLNISRGAWDPSESFSKALKTEDGARRLIEKGFYLPAPGAIPRVLQPRPDVRHAERRVAVATRRRDEAMLSVSGVSRASWRTRSVATMRRRFRETDRPR